MQQAIPDIVAVAVGNTRTRFGVFKAGSLHSPTSVVNSSVDEVASAVEEAEAASGFVVVSSVNPAFAEELCQRLEEGRFKSLELFRIGRELPVPIPNALEDDSTVGQDRLLCALGAYAKAQQAAVVIDAGTAVTVDFVDGHGTFQGGAILPGVQMMLDALHARTGALPQVKFEVTPAERAFGKDTRQAMLLGVASAVRGAVRVLLERYSEAYGAYPQVVATGGDAAALFEGDEIVEHISPDLQLVGIFESVKRMVEEGE